MSITLTTQQLVFSIALFIVVQGIGVVKGEKNGDVVLYYIISTLIAIVALWAGIVFSPLFI